LLYITTNMNIIGFVLYHLLFMCITLVVPSNYQSYILVLSMIFFLCFLCMVRQLRLPEHHLWSYLLWTLTFLFQSFMWWVFVTIDGVTHDMMYLFHAVWCTSLTFIVTGCSCFTILFGNLDWYTHLIICLEQYWLFFQFVNESSIVLQVLPIVLIFLLRMIDQLERHQVTPYTLLETLSGVVVIGLIMVDQVSWMYLFVIGMICVRLVVTSEYRLCHVAVSEDQEDVVFDDWRDDCLPIL